MHTNKDWLKAKYIDDKLNCTDIGKLANRDPKTIWSWLKRFDIPTRSRGAESSPGTFKKGHKKGVGRVHTEKTKRKIREKCIERGSVPYLVNGEHWLKNKESKDHLNWLGGLTPERQSVYSSKKWVNAVKAVWKRDNAICQNCGKHHNTEQNRGNFHIHHIITFQNRSTRTKVDNLVLLCKKCHKWVHSKNNINNKFIIKL